MPDTTNDLGFDEARLAAPTLRRTLAAGHSGHDVARLQAELRRAGVATGAIDGIFGDKTAAAVQAFATREGLAPATAVDGALWSAVLRAGAHAQADAIEAVARALEQAADGSHAAAAAAQQVAAEKRTQTVAAGLDEERAAGLLLDAGRQWRAAADRWLAVAAAVAPHADPDARAVKAHARHLNALDQARAHARRAVNSHALASRDHDAAGATDHRERIATATLAARTLAAD